MFEVSGQQHCSNTRFLSNTENQRTKSKARTYDLLNSQGPLGIPRIASRVVNSTDKPLMHLSGAVKLKRALNELTSELK